jgi:hypothetical protein
MSLAWLQRVATGRVVLITALVFVVFSIMFFNLGPIPAIMEAASSPLLDARFAGTGGDVHDFLSALGDEASSSNASGPGTSATTAGPEGCSLRSAWWLRWRVCVWRW